MIRLELEHSSGDINELLYHYDLVIKQAEIQEYKTKFGTLTDQDIRDYNRAVSFFNKTYKELVTKFDPKPRIIRFCPLYHVR